MRSFAPTNALIGRRLATQFADIEDAVEERVTVLVALRGDPDISIGLDGHESECRERFRLGDGGVAEFTGAGARRRNIVERGAGVAGDQLRPAI